MADKKSKGRQKIDVTKKIEKGDSRRVTFSKRKDGLYRKASELCTLCGIQFAIIAQSEKGTLHSFAHPDAKAVAKAFLSEPQVPVEVSPQTVARLADLTTQLSRLTHQVYAEEKRKKRLAADTHGEKDIDELNDDETKELKAWLVEFQVKSKQLIDGKTNLNKDFGAFADPNAGSSSNSGVGILADPNVASSSNLNSGLAIRADPNAGSSSNSGVGILADPNVASSSNLNSGLAIRADPNVDSLTNQISALRILDYPNVASSSNPKITLGLLADPNAASSSSPNDVFGDYVADPNSLSTGYEGA